MKAEVGDLVLWTTNHGMLYFGRVYESLLDFLTRPEDYEV